MGSADDRVMVKRGALKNKENPIYCPCNATLVRAPVSMMQRVPLKHCDRDSLYTYNEYMLHNSGNDHHPSSCCSVGLPEHGPYTTYSSASYIEFRYILKVLRNSQTYGPYTGVAAGAAT